AISNELHRRYLANPQTSLRELLDGTKIAHLDSRLSVFGTPPQDVSLIVRSNGQREGLDERGLLKSFPCDGTLDAVLAASHAVFEAADKMLLNSPVGIIVQVYRSPVSSGFLSNQRRVVAETRRWICEMTPAKDSPAETVPKVFQ